MKIQGLAVIAILILLPISIILNSYINNEVKTLSLQVSYDSKLQNATYDALKAFQLNTSNSDTSDLVNSKLRDIEAAANSFFTSLSSNFNLAGYNKEVLKNYVPAVVFTMYDGYYIYSPYTNKLDKNDTISKNATYKDDQEISGLKPYVYYSCRYVNKELDVVITYSLDNYITIQGVKLLGMEPINISGYVLSDLNQDGTKYRGINITQETNLKENVYIDENKETKSYNSKTKNGVKYYKEGSKVFTMLNGKKIEQINNLTTAEIDKNENAINFYKNAANFKKQLKELGIDKLKTSDSCNESFEKIEDFKDFNIFNGIDDTTNAIEEPNSNFNQHRLAVIRYSIEKNLSVAISNFNNYSNSSTDFQLPKLKEHEWQVILNNISIISFMQGLSIGGKVYNGYSIVPNTNNKELVSEDSINIITKNDNIAHKITDIELQGKPENEIAGVWNNNLQRKVTIGESDGLAHYFFPKFTLSSYNSLVTLGNNIELKDGNIYNYLLNYKELAKVYYTTLGRERYGMYRIEN